MSAYCLHSFVHLGFHAVRPLYSIMGQSTFHRLVSLQESSRVRFLCQEFKFHHSLKCKNLILYQNYFFVKQNQLKIDLIKVILFYSNKSSYIFIPALICIFFLLLFLKSLFMLYIYVNFDKFSIIYSVELSFISGLLLCC